MQRKGLLATAYLAAIAAGVIARQPWREVPTPTSPPLASTGAPAAVTEIKRQLAVREAEALAQREAAAQPQTEFAEPPPKTREEEIRDTIRSRRERVQADERSLADLQARSRAFQATADLGPALTDALRSEEGMAQAAAIFLEWYRRDPQTAFAEYARRPLMEVTFRDHDCLYLQFTPEEIAAQVSLVRSDEFKTRLLRGMARRFSEGNDLPGLNRLMEKLTAPQQKEVAEDFVRSDWVPDDDAAALAFMANEMPMEVRKTLLREFASCQSWYSASTWASSVASPLILQTLGQEELNRIAEQASHMPTGSGCGGGEDGEGRFEITPLIAGLSRDEAEYAVSSRVQAAFYQSRDARECFAAGTMSADEITAQVRGLIPGIEAYPQDLYHSLFAELARYQPAAAHQWAAAHMNATELANQSLEVLNCYDEPRTSRLAELLRELPLDSVDPEELESKAGTIAEKFAAWRALDPEAARKAVEAIPQNHPLRRAAAGEEAP